MASILCLAHYCDTHGPTPLMVTEGLPVSCTSCFEGDTLRTRRPSSSARSLNPLDGLAGGGRGGSRTNSTSSDKEIAAQRAALQSQSTNTHATSSAIETPPGSPRVAALQTVHSAASHRRDSSFRKTYDENDKKRAIPCENCALTLPKKTKEGAPTNTQGNSGSRGYFENSGPILRTRKAYERVAIPTAGLSPPKSDSCNSSESGDFENAISSTSRRHSRHVTRARTSSSSSSFASTISHTHYLDYTSTHEPLAPMSFSIIRQSCLRTLSCETLPPSSNQSTTTIPSSPFIQHHLPTGPSGAGTSSGGPIFFGDPLAGYTTAYIFRIPDPSARGRRRVYALMALSTHRERLAMQTFSFLSAAFRDLATWIQGLAEQELERSESSLASPHINEDKSSSSSGHISTSSFLSGRGRGPDGKFSGMGIRARGLADLVGLPDFFIELHTKFVRLLIELGMFLGI